MSASGRDFCSSSLFRMAVSGRDIFHPISGSIYVCNQVIKDHAIKNKVKKDPDQKNKIPNPDFKMREFHNTFGTEKWDLASCLVCYCEMTSALFRANCLPSRYCSVSSLEKRFGSLPRALEMCISLCVSLRSDFCAVSRKLFAITLVWCRLWINLGPLQRANSRISWRVFANRFLRCFARAVCNHVIVRCRVWKKAWRIATRHGNLHRVLCVSLRGHFLRCLAQAVCPHSRSFCVTFGKMHGLLQRANWFLAWCVFAK